MTCVYDTIPRHLSENIALVLDDMLSRLNMLQSINNLSLQRTEPKHENLFDMFVCPDLVKDTLHTMEDSKFTRPTFESDEDRRKAEENVKYAKMKSEYDFINNCVSILSSELVKKGKFKKFSNIILCEQLNNEKNEEVKTSNEKFKKQSEKFHEFQRIFEDSAKAEVKELKLVLNNLYDQRQELQHKLQMELKLFISQRKQILHTFRDSFSIEIRDIKIDLKDYREKIMKEEKVNQDFQRILRQNCTSLLLNKDEIIDKYNSAKEQILTVIGQYQRNFKTQTHQFEKLLATVHQYQETVDENNEMHKELRIQEEKEAILQNMAKIIQKWWKCMTVVKELISKKKKSSKKSKKSKK